MGLAPLSLVETPKTALHRLHRLVWWKPPRPRCIALVLLSLIAHLFSSLLNVIDEVKNPVNNDFYEQVKELLAPSSAYDFQSFTIREFIRENQLHSDVRNRLGKSGSKARHFELVAALQ